MGLTKGITEQYWSDLHEDQKMEWRLFTRGLSLLAALVVTKIGMTYFDWAVGGFTAVLPMLIIDSQRAYSKMSPLMRKKIIRVVVVMGSWAFAVLGILFLAHLGLISILQTLLDMARTHSWNNGSEFHQVFVMFFVLVVSLYAVVRVIRKIGLEDLIFHAPRRGILKLFVVRRYSAQTFPTFANFELSVIAISYLYTSAISGVAILFFEISNWFK